MQEQGPRHWAAENPPAKHVRARHTPVALRERQLAESVPALRWGAAVPTSQVKQQRLRGPPQGSVLPSAEQ